MRAILTILALWAAGLGAAAQFGKISIAYQPLGLAYPAEAGVWIGLMVSIVGMVGLIFGTTARLHPCRKAAKVTGLVSQLLQRLYRHPRPRPRSAEYRNRRARLEAFVMARPLRIGLECYQGQRNMDGPLGGAGGLHLGLFPHIDQKNRARGHFGNHILDGHVRFGAQKIEHGEASDWVHSYIFIKLNL